MNEMRLSRATVGRTNLEGNFGHKMTGAASCATYSCRENAYAYGRLGLHVVLALLLVEFALFLRRGVLVLLVLRHQVVHVALRFRELHLVHALAGVPVQECF